MYICTRQKSWNGSKLAISIQLLNLFKEGLEITGVGGSVELDAGE